MAKIRHGDIVRWKKEFAQSDEERHALLVALEPAEDGRCYVRPLTWDRATQGAVVPTQMTKTEYLEVIS